jgi:hypothetical protein
MELLCVSIERIWILKNKEDKNIVFLLKALLEYFTVETNNILSLSSCNT